MCNLGTNSVPGRNGSGSDSLAVWECTSLKSHRTEEIVTPKFTGEIEIVLVGDGFQGPAVEGW